MQNSRLMGNMELADRMQHLTISKNSHITNTSSPYKNPFAGASTATALPQQTAAENQPRERNQTGALAQTINAVSTTQPTASVAAVSRHATTNAIRYCNVSAKILQEKLQQTNEKIAKLQLEGKKKNKKNISMATAVVNMGIMKAESLMQQQYGANKAPKGKKAEVLKNCAAEALERYPQLEQELYMVGAQHNYLRQYPMGQKLAGNGTTVPRKQNGQQSQRAAGGADQPQREETTHRQRNSASESAAAETSQSKSSKRNKKRAHKNKTQQSEQAELAKYLKNILCQHLGEEESKLGALEFRADKENLEQYAQRLIAAGLGRIVEASIRINRKNNHQSFITMSEDRNSTERDGMCLVPIARQYAFEGDIVRAFVLNTKTQDSSNEPKTKDETVLSDEDSPDSDLTTTDEDETDAPQSAAQEGCPKAFVISIVKQSANREVVGSISFKNSVKLNDEQLYYKVKPHDMRMPFIYVPVESCKEQLAEEDTAQAAVGMLYIVRVCETDVDGHCIGELHQALGKVGHLESEVKAILASNGLKDLRPYEERFNAMFSQSEPIVSDEELKYRSDFRKKCIFTIDPLTARDLDDAVSIDKLPNGLYELGVHISDVAFYCAEDSELDNIVKQRATSVYLVNEVIHMLPQPLCFKCSLLPAEDKYAFSVLWTLNDNADIVGEPRFMRSIINSCTQFAYEHAQKIIDNPQERFSWDDFPIIANGFTPADIQERVLLLHALAQKLRTKRYDNGALSINNPKLRFTLDPSNGEPVSYEVESRQEANFLIEEYMLLANQAVAKQIFKHFPDISILRNHGPPLTKSLKVLKDNLAKHNIQLDFSSSKAIHNSILRICAAAVDPMAMDVCLSQMLTKPMARARYICSESVKSDKASLSHYALAIPIYTHFTSPIRRYPDILVHRLLAASLNYTPPPKRAVAELHLIASVCNEQKLNAKSAGDDSMNLYFKRYLERKALVRQAVVMEIYQHMANVVVVETGHVVPLIYRLQKVLVDASKAPEFIRFSEKKSEVPPIKLTVLSTVNIRLTVWDGKLTAFLISPDPKQRRLNSQSQEEAKQAKNRTDSVTESTMANARVTDKAADSPQKSRRRQRSKRGARDKARTNMVVSQTNARRSSSSEQEHRVNGSWYREGPQHKKPEGYRNPFAKR